MLERHGDNHKPVPPLRRVINAYSEVITAFQTDPKFDVEAAADGIYNAGWLGELAERDRGLSGDTIRLARAAHKATFAGTDPNEFKDHPITKFLNEQSWFAQIRENPTGQRPLRRGVVIETLHTPQLALPQPTGEAIEKTLITSEVEGELIPKTTEDDDPDKRKLEALARQLGEISDLKEDQNYNIPNPQFPDELLNDADRKLIKDIIGKVFQPGNPDGPLLKKDKLEQLKIIDEPKKSETTTSPSDATDSQRHKVSSDSAVNTYNTKAASPPPITPTPNPNEKGDKKLSKHAGRRHLVKGLFFGLGAVSIFKRDSIGEFLTSGFQSSYEKKPEYAETHSLTTEFGPLNRMIQVRYPEVEEGWELRNIWGTSAIVSYKGDAGTTPQINVAIPWDSSLYPNRKTSLLDNVYVNIFNDVQGQAIPRLNFGWRDKEAPQHEYLLRGNLTEPNGSYANDHPDHVEMRFTTNDKPLYLSFKANEVTELENGKPKVKQQITITTLEKVRKQN